MDRNGKRPRGKNLAGASSALWKLRTDFRNLRIENDLIKRHKRMNDFNNFVLGSTLNIGEKERW